MIDIHTHIIPSIDDGSKSIKETIEMLKCAEANGTNKIIATPHYYLDYGETKYNEVKSLAQNINNIAKENNINVEVYHGQEVYFTDNIVNDYLEGNIGTINNSRYMLIEFSLLHLEKNIVDVLYELQIRGIIPIIAHPERYRTFADNPCLINKFIDQGYLFQLNSGSIEGIFGNSARKNAELFLKHNIYSFIGSDAHNISSRTTNMTNSFEKINKINSNLLSEFDENAIKLLNNGEITFYGDKISPKRSIFSFFKK